MSTVTKILEDKLELINWITDLKDNRVLDKLLFLMQNYKPQKVTLVDVEESNLDTTETTEIDTKKHFNEAIITDADQEAIDEETKRRFPHLF